MFKVVFPVWSIVIRYYRSNTHSIGLSKLCMWICFCSSEHVFKISWIYLFLLWRFIYAQVNCAFMKSVLSWIVLPLHKMKNYFENFHFVLIISKNFMNPSLIFAIFPRQLIWRISKNSGKFKFYHLKEIWTFVLRKSDFPVGKHCSNTLHVLHNEWAWFLRFAPSLNVPFALINLKWPFVEFSGD